MRTGGGKDNLGEFDLPASLAGGAKCREVNGAGFA
jgi:hypothetical protein